MQIKLDGMIFESEKEAIQWLNSELDKGIKEDQERARWEKEY